MKNRYTKAFLLTVGLLVISWFLYIIEIKSIEGILLSEVVEKLNKGYRIKQILIIMSLYGWGWIILKVVLKHPENYWYTFLAFPTAVAVWCILSHMVILIGIPYTVATMGFIAISILFLCLYLMQNVRNEINLPVLLHNLIYLIGISSLATSGVFPTTMSSDSYHFVMQLGQMIAITGKYDTSFGHMLVETGQAPALMAAIPALFGFENIFGMHHVLMLSFLTFFVSTLYKNLLEVIGKRKAMIISLFALLFLLGCRSVILLIMWPISSAYWMVYATIFMICIYEIYEVKHQDVIGAECFLGLLCMMLCILRGEGPVLLCFYLVCLSTLNIRPKTLVSFVFPSIVIMAIYYGYVYFKMEIRDADMLTPLNMLVILLGMSSLLIFFAFFRDMVQRYLYILIWVGLIALNIIVFMINSEQYFYNIKIAVQNYTDHVWWGMFPWILLCIIAVVIHIQEESRTIYLYIVGGTLLNFSFYAIRSLPMRIGTGDSFNRIMIAWMPSVVYLICREIFGEGYPKAGLNSMR